MVRRLTHEELLQRAREVHGDRYDYDFSTFNGTLKQMTMTCRTHGSFKQCPSNHFKGQGCPACAGKVPITTDDFIRRSRETHGDRYDYSLSEYLNNSTKLTIICTVHGPFEQTPVTHWAGSGCPDCGGTKKLTQEQFIAASIKAHGDEYSYTKTIYKNNREKVIVTCKVHGDFLAVPADHMMGKRCARCVGNAPLDTKTFIKKAREIHGDKYDYSMVKYERADRKVSIVCKEHGPFKQKPNSHLSGNGCIKCVHENSPIRDTHETFLEKARSVHGDRYDYSGVSYEKCDVHVAIGCETHGIFHQMPEKHVAGQGCPSCAHSGPSAPQIEIQNYLEQFTMVAPEVREPGLNSRLDMLLPEHSIAVEYHGLIWHSSKFLKDPRKDFKKHKRMADLGVRTIHIYEDEWLLKKEVVKRMLLSAIGHLPKIYARETELVQLTSEQAKMFYEDHHLQGGRQSRISFGLEYRSALVAAMSFDMLRSERKNSDTSKWELVRYASTLSVVGGPSRLFKAFLSLGVAESVTSYSDVRAFTGSMYDALGFTKTHVTDPDYWYTNGRPSFGRRNKSGYQKKHLAKMFPHEDIDSQTEWEICEKNSLYRIYDCGKVRWDYLVKPSRQSGTEPQVQN